MSGDRPASATGFTSAVLEVTARVAMFPWNLCHVVSRRAVRTRSPLSLLAPLSRRVRPGPAAPESRDPSSGERGDDPSHGLLQRGSRRTHPGDRAASLQGNLCGHQQIGIPAATDRARPGNAGRALRPGRDGRPRRLCPARGRGGALVGDAGHARSPEAALLVGVVLGVGHDEHPAGVGRGASRRHVHALLAPVGC